MNKKWLLVLFFFLVFVSCARKEIITYKNKKFGFSVNIPSKWEKLDEKEMMSGNYLFVAFHNSKIDSTFDIGVNRYGFFDGINYEPPDGGNVGDAKTEAIRGFNDTAEATYKGMGQKAEIIFERSVIINGLEGYQIVYKWIGQPPFLPLTTEAFFVKGNTVYRLSFDVKKGNFEKYRQEIFEKTILTGLSLF